MDDNASPPDDPIETIRREIDGIDATLLSLIAERLQLADKLRGAKAPQAGLPIRPGREIIMLRRLIAEAPPPLERELVVELWRALISASLRKQGPIDVAIGGNKQDFRLFDAARRHFGARTRIEYVGEPQAALRKAAVADEADSSREWLAVTPWPAAPGVGAWWPALSENAYNRLHLIAALPLLREANEPPIAAVFAASPPEEAGGDETILLVFDPHHRLQRVLSEQGLKGAEMARAEPRALVRVEGFIGPDDLRAAAMTRSGLQSVRVLGSYARI